MWPTIINTSSIAIRREFIQKILNNNFTNDFNLLEIDFIINVYSRNIDNNFIITNGEYTIYRQLDDSIIGNIKKYSKKWWKKRQQAHQFMKTIYFNCGLKYKNGPDQLITNFINKIINF